jgi:hypothetical protein
MLAYCILCSHDLRLEQLREMRLSAFDQVLYLLENSRPVYLEVARAVHCLLAIADK